MSIHVSAWAHHRAASFTQVKRGRRFRANGRQKVSPVFARAAGGGQKRVVLALDWRAVCGARNTFPNTLAGPGRARFARFCRCNSEMALRVQG
jgi:hypothetical protein